MIGLAPPEYDPAAPTTATMPPAPNAMRAEGAIGTTSSWTSFMLRDARVRGGSRAHGTRSVRRRVRELPPRFQDLASGRAVRERCYFAATRRFAHTTRFCTARFTLPPSPTRYPP